jgi:Protein of unknown function (DUF732)
MRRAPKLVFCARDNRLMVFDRAAAEIPESVKARGIVDRATGIERARASRQWLRDAAWNALKRTDQLQTSHFLIMGLADPGSDFLMLLGKYNLNLSALAGKTISSQVEIQLGQDICTDLHSGTPVTTVVNEIYRDMPNITDKQAGNPGGSRSADQASVCDGSGVGHVAKARGAVVGA